MIKESEHLFRNSLEELRICISEVIEEDYGLYVWPSSIVLAEYIWQNRDRFVGSEVLELGAGTALPGIVAAKVGAHVTLTDLDSKPEIQALTWGQWDVGTFDLSPDIVLGADVLYSPSDFEDLFATVTFFLQKKRGSVFITAYEPRSGHRSIELLMAKWKLQCTKLMDGHQILPEAKLSSVPTSIQIVEVVAVQ